MIQLGLRRSGTGRRWRRSFQQLGDLHAVLRAGPSIGRRTDDHVSSFCRLRQFQNLLILVLHCRYFGCGASLRLFGWMPLDGRRDQALYAQMIVAVLRFQANFSKMLALVGCISWHAKLADNVIAFRLAFERVDVGALDAVPTP